MTRTSLVHAIAACAALGIALGACGHYGPPVRPKPAPAAAESDAPPADPEKAPKHVQ